MLEENKKPSGTVAVPVKDDLMATNSCIRKEVRRRFQNLKAW